MATSEILQFAENATTGVSGNIYTQAEYVADVDQLGGVKPGIAKEKLHNKTLKQVSLISAGLAKFIADNQAVNITDLLTVANIATYLTSAIQAIAGAFASQAEVDAGVVANEAVTPLTLKNGFAASFTTNGYIKFPSWLGALIINWGTATTPGGGGVTVTFPLAFPTAVYSIQTTLVPTGGTARGITLASVTVANFIANTFIPSTGASTGEPFFFLAFGR